MDRESRATGDGRDPPDRRTCKAPPLAAATRRISGYRSGALHGKGRTVATCEADDVASSNYVGLVESTYLDSIVNSNREGVIEMDSGFAQLKESALTEVAHFAERVREARRATFLERRAVILPCFVLPQRTPLSKRRRRSLTSCLNV